MVGAAVLTPEEAYGAIDLGTITLLLGMMIVVANLRHSTPRAVLLGPCYVMNELEYSASRCTST
jgi:di/tricarboxylate transporter